MDGKAGPWRRELRVYLRLFARSLGTIIVISLVTMVVAVLYSSLKGSTYAAQAQVLVRPLPTDEREAVPAQQQESNMQTEAAVAASRPVAALVQEDLDLQLTPGRLLSRLMVKPTENSSVLLITYRDERPTAAAAIANAFARQYIEYRRDRATREIQAEIRPYRERLKALAAQFEQLDDQSRAARERGDGEALDRLAQRREELAQRRVALRQRIQSAPLDQVALGGGTVIRPAVEPAPRSWRDQLGVALAGLGLGCLFGLTVVILRHRMDSRLRTPEQVETAMGAPVIGWIPASQEVGTDPSLLHDDAMASTAGEAFRGLRAALHIQMERHSLHTFIVTSALPSEGKSVVAMNLATAAARAGRKVTLVEADLRQPSLKRYVTSPLNVSLDRWLTDTDADEPFIESAPGLSMAVADKPVRNPGDAIASERFARLIELARRDSDLVLIDTPPVLACSDALVSGGYADAAIVVVNPELVDEEAAERTRALLDRVDIEPIYCVMNECPPEEWPFLLFDYYVKTSGTEVDKTRTDPETLPKTAAVETTAPRSESGHAR